MRLTIAYSKIKKQNLELINNDTYQRETLSERPIRQPLSNYQRNLKKKRNKNLVCPAVLSYLSNCAKYCLTKNQELLGQLKS